MKKELLLNKATALDVVAELTALAKSGQYQLTISDGQVGKWTMARLWRSWMESTAQFMTANGVFMPMYFDSQNRPHGRRDFNAEDAHQLFTMRWLGTDAEGSRLSW